VADLAPGRVAEFCAALTPAFYIDSEVVESAVRTGRPLTRSIWEERIIRHFPGREDRFARSELARRRYTTTTITGLENIGFPVASAEDTILAKLAWFRQGARCPIGSGTIFSA